MSTAMRACPNCGHQVAQASFRCPSCKELLPSMLATPPAGGTKSSGSSSGAHFGPSAKMSSGASLSDDSHTFASLVGNMLSSEGRAGRLEYFVSSMLIVSVMMIVALLAGGMLILISPVLGLLVMAVLMLGAGVMGLLAAARRFHDMDKSGWLVVLIFVPLVNILALLALYFLPGSPGSNQYGEDPTTRKMPQLFIWLSIGLVLLSLIVQCSVDPSKRLERNSTGLEMKSQILLA